MKAYIVEMLPSHNTDYMRFGVYSNKKSAEKRLKSIEKEMKTLIKNDATELKHKIEWINKDIFVHIVNNETMNSYEITEVEIKENEF
ncbi:MAG: hypothetical protein IKP65_06605 [Alphaproteobacteria bacterium]|nr:hypothetical protein [Alphaproteobacteria bacterium]